MAQSPQASSVSHSSLPPLRPGPHQRRLDLIAVVATFGGLLFGYDLGVMNGVLAPLRDDMGLTDATEGLVTATLLLGAAIGAAAGGRLNDRIGRRKTLTIAAVLFFIGALGGVVAPNIELLAPMRVVLGFAVGCASVTVPVYLAELAPTERRGRLSGRNELAIVIGQMSAFIINAVIYNLWGDLPGVWRIMLAVSCLPAIPLFLGMLRMPESPRWLISQGRHDEALAVLMQVRTKDRALAEMAEVEVLAEEEAQASTGGWADLAVPWVRRLVLIGCGLAAAQQLTGINYIFTYGTQLLEQAGFSSSAAIIANTANGVLALAGTVICLFWIVDRVSRRKLIIFGFVSTTVCHALIIFAAMTMADGTPRAVVILILSVTFVFFYELSLNVPVWVCLSEMFPLRMRGFGMGVCVTVLWVVNAGLTFSFPIIVGMAGFKAIFTMFFVAGLVIVAFLWKYLPNTGGRSLEELEEDFAAGNFVRD